MTANDSTLNSVYSFLFRKLSGGSLSVCAADLDTYDLGYVLASFPQSTLALTNAAVSAVTTASNDVQSFTVTGTIGDWTANGAGLLIPPLNSLTITVTFSQAGPILLGDYALSGKLAIDGKPYDISGEMQVGGAIQFSFGEGVSPPLTVEKFADFVTDAAFGNFLPGPLSDLGTLTLKTLLIEMDCSSDAITSLDFNAEASLEDDWDIISGPPAIKLSGVRLTLARRQQQGVDGGLITSYTGMISGKIDVGNTTVDVTADLTGGDLLKIRGSAADGLLPSLGDLAYQIGGKTLKKSIEADIQDIGLGSINITDITFTVRLGSDISLQSITVNGSLEIFSRTFEMFLAPPVEAGQGWRFNCFLAAGDVDIDIGILIADFGSKFGSVTLPSFLTGLKIESIGFSVDTKTKDFTFELGTTDLVGGNSMIDATVVIDMQMTHDGGYDVTFKGAFELDSLKFTAAFGSGSTQSLVAACHAGWNVDLKTDLVDKIDPTLAAGLPNGLTFRLNDILIVLLKESQPSSTKLLFGLSLGDTFSLSDLPLVGANLASIENIAVEDLQIIVSSEAPVSSTDLSSFNGAIGDLGDDFPGFPPQLTTATGKVSLAAKIALGIESKPIFYSLGGSENGRDRGIEGNTTQSVPHAAALSSGGSGSTAGHTDWITVQKSFGPLSIEKIGVKYQSANQRLWFDIDATLKVGPVSVTLDNLGIGSSLADFDPQVSLNGLGISYEKPPLTISGSFMNLNPEYGFEFDGSVGIGTDDFELDAIGFYGNQTGSTSMFIYGDLARSFGGPPAFFVTGVALGFGYNSALRLPTIGEVASFPLLEFLPNSIPPTATPPPTTPQAALNQLVTQSPSWVTEAPGSLWFAAGITFTSFELVNSQAVVIVEPGPDLTISLVGTSQAKFPQNSGAGGPTYAYLNLDLDANFKPQEGAFSLQAVLSRSSYLLDKACVLSGGFAFEVWFGDNEHAGDFVLTLGGYSSAFNPPSYYPSVPRLGFHWSLDSSITVSGNAYLAFTPSVMMVGGELSAVYHSGNLKAWFDAQADIIVQWKPFWFDANIRISVGASYRVDLLFTSFTVSVEIGCDLGLWGPPTGGRVHVDWYIISFTIPFGASRSAGLSHLTWNDVQAMLPNSGTPDHPNVLSLTPTGGIASPSAEGGASGWIVRGSQFGFATSSSIPATTATVGESHTFNGDTFNVAPLGWSDISATHRVTIENAAGVDVSASFNVIQARKSLPSALWGAPPSTTPSTNDQLVSDQITGVTVLVKPPQVGSSAGPVSVEQCLEGVSLGLPGAELSVANDATPSGTIPINSRTTISDIISGISASSTCTERNSIYAALKTVNYAPATADDSMVKFANGIGSTFRANPLLST